MTIAFAQPGDVQSERDFNEQGEESAPLLWHGRHGRGGKGWFSVDMPVGDVQRTELLITYGGKAWQKSTFDVMVNGQKIGDRDEPARTPDQENPFVDVRYALPAELIAGKSKITVRFQATNGNEIRGIFGVRTVRGDVAR